MSLREKLSRYVRKTEPQPSKENFFRKLASDMHGPSVFFQLQHSLDMQYLRRVMHLNKNSDSDPKDAVRAYLHTRGDLQAGTIDERLERMRDGWSAVVKIAAQRDYFLPERVDLRRYLDYENQPEGVGEIKFLE